MCSRVVSPVPCFTQLYSATTTLKLVEDLWYTVIKSTIGSDKDPWSAHPNKAHQRIPSHTLWALSQCLRNEAGYEST